jgi:hypothetical protein
VNLIRDKEDLLEPMLQDPKLVRRLLAEEENLVRVSPYFLFTHTQRSLSEDSTGTLFPFSNPGHLITNKFIRIASEAAEESSFSEMRSQTLMPKGFTKSCGDETIERLLLNVRIDHIGVSGNGYLRTASSGGGSRI